MHEWDWEPVGPADSLPVGECTLVRAGTRRVAVFRTDDGEVHAVDDQCPHEGYPLSKGKLIGGVLTCSWHNYKFDLATGRCLKGDEDVPCHAARIRDGLVEIRVVEPPREQLIAKHFRGLEESLADRRTGQAAREVVRLLQLDVPPHELAVAAASWDAAHAEYGTTHALPVAVDAIRLAHRRKGSAAALPLMHAFEMASEASVRRPPRLVASAIGGGDETAFLGAVEAEEEQRAEGILRGALAEGRDPQEIERWLLLACTQYFLGFGHALIYTVKAFDLLRIAGWHHAPAILPGLVVGIVNQTREDVLPEWAWFRRRLEGVDLPERGDGPAPDIFDAVVDGSREEAFDAVLGALRDGASPAGVAHVLINAAAERILRFDLAVDDDDTTQEGWLDVTHTLTFAHACRHAVERLDRPEALRLLLYAARFINNAKALDGRRASSPSVDLTDPDALECSFDDRILGDHAVRPIISAHVIKLASAAFDAYRLAPFDLPRRALPVEAFVRFATAPVRQRFLTRLVHEAIRFTEEGKVPKTLT